MATPKKSSPSKKIQTLYTSTPSFGVSVKSSIFQQTLPFRFHSEKDKLFGFQTQKEGSFLGKKNTLTI
jgi:hypothetical protein